MKRTLLIFNTHNFHHWAANDPHETPQLSHQYHFNVCVWAGNINNNLIDPYLIYTFSSDCIRGRDIYGGCFAWVVEKHSLDIRRSMQYQHDEAPTCTLSRRR